MKFKKIIHATIILGIGFSFPAYANQIALNALAGGSIFALGHQENIAFPADTFRTDTFKVNGNPINYALAGGVTYDIDNCPAIRRVDSPIRDIALGFNIYYSQTSRNGPVLEYGLPNFSNSTYDMKIKSTRLMLDSEFNFYPIWKCITPFIEVGLGAANNTLTFRNTTLSNIEISGGNYSLLNNSEIQFAYEIGAGAKWPIHKCIILSARYLYANAGDAQSSQHDNSNGVVLRKPIKVSVESQSILLGISYLFG